MKRLNQGQLKYVKGRVEGKKQVHACMEAYPNMSYDTAASHATHLENNPRVSKAIEQALAKKNLTLDKIAETISEGLSANKCIYDTQRSSLVETDSPDHNIRHKYLTTLIDITGVKSPEKKEITFLGIMGMLDPDKIKEIKSRMG